MKRFVGVLLLMSGACGGDECDVPEGVYNVVATPVSDACEIGGFTETAEFDGAGTTGAPPEGCARTSSYTPNACGFTVTDECTDADGPYSFQTDLSLNDDASRMEGTLRVEFRFPDGSIDCASTLNLVYTRI